ncbi:hypothetical protein F4604DRAFT_1684481 [Suillus subluteus]|nr:hypothetical protein F4604DRAFT_1684481 [Suillus subluteus]
MKGQFVSKPRYKADCSKQYAQTACPSGQSIPGDLLNRSHGAHEVCSYRLKKAFTRNSGWASSMGNWNSCKTLAPAIQSLPDLSTGYKLKSYQRQAPVPYSFCPQNSLTQFLLHSGAEAQDIRQVTECFENSIKSAAARSFALDRAGPWHPVSSCGNGGIIRPLEGCTGDGAGMGVADLVVLRHSGVDVPRSKITGSNVQNDTHTSWLIQPPGQHALGILGCQMFLQVSIHIVWVVSFQPADVATGGKHESTGMVFMIRQAEIQIMDEDQNVWSWEGWCHHNPSGLHGTHGCQCFSLAYQSGYRRLSKGTTDFSALGPVQHSSAFKSNRSNEALGDTHVKPAITQKHG